MGAESIPMMFQGIQLNDPLEQYGKRAALSHMAAQGRLIDSQVAEKEQANTLSKMRQQALAGAGGDMDRAKASLMSMGDYAGAHEIEKNQLETQKTQADISSSNTKNQAALWDHRKQVAAFVADGGTMNHAGMAVDALAKGGDVQGAQWLQGLIQQYPNATPEQIRSVMQPIINMGISAKDRAMPNMEKAGNRLTNTNPFVSTPDIAIGVSPDTLVKEQGDDRRAAQAKASNPYFQFLPTADGYRVGDARTGRISIPENKVVPATADPSLQGAIAGAKNTAEMRAKREFNMTGIGSVIQEADDLLSGRDSATGKSAPLPTGSAIGAGVDLAASAFGASPSGSKEAQRLKALSGALTAKMPRMEGPQSDKDVAMYKEMAAEIGNPMVPVARRKAALDTVRKLWGKYDKSAPATGGAKFLGFE